VRNYDFNGDGGVVETYIGYLRRKVDNAQPKLIHTIRGFGYSLRAQ
jgi:two-component system OmpR family response regulator